MSEQCKREMQKITIHIAKPRLVQHRVRPLAKQQALQLRQLGRPMNEYDNGGVRRSMNEYDNGGIRRC